MKVHFINLGCAKNLADAEVLCGILAKKGIKFSARAKDSDVVVINTCGFLKSAEKEIRGILNDLKEEFSKNKKFPKIILGGCFPQRLKASGKIKRMGVDLLLGVDEFFKLPEILEKYEKEGKLKRGFLISPQPSFIYKDASYRLIPSTGSAYVKISDGCNNECSFCTIPLIKGKQRSRKIEDVVRECKSLAEGGVKEINLVSQDTGIYGVDLGERKHNLLLLLENLEKIKGLKWVRLLYLYPRLFSKEFLTFIRESKKVLPYFDIPIQHADPKILKLMRRGTHPELLRRIISEIREEIPHAILRTTVIVGFPGEGVREFKNLLNFLEEIKFHYVGVFEYSREKGTASYKLGDPVTRHEKIKRREEVESLQKEISNFLFRKFLNKKIEFLCEMVFDNHCEGRLWFQAPEIDGITILYEKLEPGEMRKIKVSGVSGYKVEGVI